MFQGRGFDLGTQILRDRSIDALGSGKEYFDLALLMPSAEKVLGHTRLF